MKICAAATITTYPASWCNERRPTNVESTYDREATYSTPLWDGQCLPYSTGNPGYTRTQFRRAVRPVSRRTMAVETESSFGASPESRQVETARHHRRCRLPPPSRASQALPHPGQQRVGTPET